MAMIQNIVSVLHRGFVKEFGRGRICVEECPGGEKGAFSVVSSRGGKSEGGGGRNSCQETPS